VKIIFQIPSFQVFDVDFLRDLTIMSVIAAIILLMPVLGLIGPLGFFSRTGCHPDHLILTQDMCYLSGFLVYLSGFLVCVVLLTLFISVIFFWAHCGERWTKDIKREGCKSWCLQPGIDDCSWSRRKLVLTATSIIISLFPVAYGVSILTNMDYGICFLFSFMGYFILFVTGMLLAGIVILICECRKTVDQRWEQSIIEGQSYV